jgi:hypothetical protein
MDEWSDNDIRFFSSLGNKAGAYWWMAKKTESLYEDRRDALRLVGVLLCISAALCNIITAIVSNDENTLMIVAIVCSIFGILGSAVNNVDALLNYDDEIKTFRYIMESNGLIYWEIYRTLQMVGTSNETDITVFRALINEREKDIIRKHREFPDKIIRQYYDTFGQTAVDYDVLFNNKIDPIILDRQQQEEPNHRHVYDLEKYLNSIS